MPRDHLDSPTKTIRWTSIALASLLPLGAVASCGGSDSDSDPAGSGGTGGLDVGGGGAPDSSAGTPSTGDGGEPAAGGCPIYHTLCGGECIYTGNDPNNCGDCGVKCDAGQVCSAGGCQDGCLPGLSACEGSCGDSATDNKNCGSCGNECGPDEGCVEGSCQSAAVFDPPAKCKGGSGPPIDVGVGGVGCSGDLGATTFTWALCSCTNVQIESEVLVDGFDSTKGPYVPGQLGGGVGANQSALASEGSIYGQFWIGEQGLTSESGLNVYADLRSAGTITSSGLSVETDAYVAGDINGDISVGGTLHTPTDPGNGNGDATYGDIDVGPVETPLPCDCENPIPVADIVAAKKDKNDNALIDLDPGILDGANHPARIDLPCGEYYLTGFNLTGPGAIVVHGHTAIYVDGDITASAFFAITPEPGGSLDLFVSGTIGGTDQIKIGSANYPALTRIYVGGAQTLELSSEVVIAGNLWVGGKVLWSSDTDMFGSIFAADFEATSALNIHYDRAIVTEGGTCDPPPDDSCGTCKDCGNQACIDGACGECGSNGDCCAPLECVSGVCVQPAVVK